MGDADSGVGRVDVLPTFSSRAIGVDTKFVGLDVDDDGVIDLRRYEDRGERGMTALCRVEG